MTPRRLGHYELRGELGRGGMGVVYRAFDAKLQREVAIKTISGLADAEAVERFVREARAAARLRHPGVVAVHDAGTIDGTCFVALELVPGGSLQKRVAEGGPLAAREAACLVRDLARAVQAAHDAGIVHRDLKPANVLLDPDGRPRLTDFGLARDDRGTEITETGVALGTPAYMAPEQARGDKAAIEPVTDVYGLGAVLYHVLTGTPPFPGSSGLVVLNRVIHEDVEPPSQRRAEKNLPPLARDLETICLKALEKRPGDRYASATALAEDLDRFVKGEAIAARPLAARERARRWLHRHRLAVLVAGLVVGAVATALADVVVQRRTFARQQRRRAEEATIAAVASFRAACAATVASPNDESSRENAIGAELRVLAHARSWMTLEGVTFDERESARKLGAEALENAVDLRSMAVADLAADLVGGADAPLVLAARRRIASKQALHERCQAALRLGSVRQLQRARAEVDEAVRLDPNDVEVRFTRAVIAFDTNDTDTALADLAIVLELVPRYAAALTLRARAHLARRDAAAAIRDCDRALVIVPRDAAALTARAKARLESQPPDAEAALPDIEAALAIDPSLPEAHYLRGLIALDHHDLDSAIASLERAATLAPLQPTMRLALADAYRLAGRKKDAARMLVQVLLLNPTPEQEATARQLLDELGVRR